MIDIAYANAFPSVSGASVAHACMTTAFGTAQAAAADAGARKSFTGAAMRPAFPARPWKDTPPRELSRL